MCTIGNSFYRVNGIDVQSVFKQCDLVDPTQFLTPVVRSDNDIRYVAFTRIKNEDCPAWAGVNEYGVSFVAADSYLKESKADSGTTSVSGGKSVFDMYLSIISSYKTAREAVIMAKKFYKTEKYGEPLTDILLISDEKEMYFIETVNGEVRTICRNNGHFVSTNHCRMFYEAVPYDLNHSTYLRLSRAEQILHSRSDINGIGNLLRDSYYGKTIWSICRYPNLTEMDDNNHSGMQATEQKPDEDLYYTQAAVIFTVKHSSISGEKPEIICEYVINNNAAVENAGYVWKPFQDEAPVKVAYIGKSENII